MLTLFHLILCISYTLKLIQKAHLASGKLLNLCAQYLSEGDHRVGFANCGDQISHQSRVYNTHQDPADQVISQCRNGLCLRWW
jgi:hypothetical protein